MSSLVGSAPCETWRRHWSQRWPSRCARTTANSSMPPRARNCPRERFVSDRGRARGKDRPSSTSRGAWKILRRGLKTEMRRSPMATRSRSDRVENAADGTKGDLR